ncbi:MAG TPA: flagellar protein FlgN [Candidatus Brocadiia bacterium]|nr:flagellar protein FlgN [Candidatus Brocadiia bacterium]
MSAETILNLQKNLAESEKLYSELLELARVKQTHLVANDLDSLKTDLQREQALLARISRVENSRAQLHAQCIESLGLDKEVCRLEQLAPHLPPEMQDEFRRSRERLIATIEALHKVNSANIALINTSLDIIERAIQAVFGAETPASAYNAYGARASRFCGGSALSALA